MLRTAFTLAGWLAMIGIASAQYPLYPSQMYPGGKEVQRWHAPPPQTQSDYATAAGLSRGVGWPTSLYGPIVPSPQSLAPPPPYLAYSPSQGLIPNATGFDQANPNLMDRNNSTILNRNCSTCNDANNHNAEKHWWQIHRNGKTNSKSKGCYATHFGMGCGSFKSEMVFLFGSCRAFYGETCSPDSVCPTPWDLLYGTSEAPDHPFGG